MSNKEEELLDRALQGDETAFEELVRFNQNKIYYHCLSIVRDKESAQDLTQETFLHAYTHLKDFKRRSRFSTWIWRIAHNLSLNYLKKHQMKELQLDEQKSAAKEHEITETEDIEKKIELLPEKQRVVFEMYYLNGIPQKQIAAQLNIPHGTVRSRLHTARRKLRQLLTYS